MITIAITIILISIIIYLIFNSIIIKTIILKLAILKNIYKLLKIQAYDKITFVNRIGNFFIINLNETSVFVKIFLDDKRFMIIFDKRVLFDSNSVTKFNLYNIYWKKIYNIFIDIYEKDYNDIYTLFPNSDLEIIVSKIGFEEYFKVPYSQYLYVMDHIDYEQLNKLGLFTTEYVSRIIDNPELLYYNPDDYDLDTILDKINAEGMISLTPGEINHLLKYKNE